MPRPSKNQHVVAVLRKAIGLGQQQLARRIGVSKSLIQKIEVSNEREMTGEVAKRMADHTGVDIDWLVAGDYQKPPLTVSGEPVTWEKYDRHRAWMEEVKPATDAQWAQFQEFVKGAAIGLEGSEQLIPDDSAEMRRTLEDQAGLEFKLSIMREGKRLELPENLRGLDRPLAKRLQAGFVMALRRNKVAELRAQFEALTQAVFEHGDGDFLLWQFKEQLTEFKAKHKLT